MTDTSSLRVDGVRLTTRLEELSRVGRQPDGGITRLALTSVEREAHALFERWARQSGLGVSTDTAGNLFCQLDGQDASLAPLSWAHTLIRYRTVSPVAPATMP